MGFRPKNPNARVAPEPLAPPSAEPIYVARARHRSAPGAARPAATSPTGDNLDSNVDVARHDLVYEVGYKKPPKATRFRPGQSGNLRGRPKGARGLNTIARKILTETIVARTAAGEKRISRIEGILQKTVELALKGNPRALGQLLSLYANAVPEDTESASPKQPEELTATDQAILDHFIERLRDGEDEQ